MARFPAPPSFAATLAVTLALVACAAGSARAGDTGSGRAERYRFGAETREIVRDSARHLLISRDCVDSAPADSAAAAATPRRIAHAGCEARRRLAEASLALTWKSLGGGVNPGAMICLRLGGHVTLGQDAHGNQNSFCRFGDGSLVSSGTLQYHARLNDGRR